MQAVETLLIIPTVRRCHLRSAAVAVFCVLLACVPPIARSDEPGAMEQTAPGVYRLGPVVIDKAAREVRFPAVVNQTAGPVEYLLVGKGGKTHESVLRTEVTPMQVQTAVLLLGVGKIAAAPGQAAPPPAAIDSAYLATAPLPEGKPVSLFLRWKDADGQRVERRAEAVVEDLRTDAPAGEGPWLYNGSFFQEGRFQADAEKSFVALVTDPSALVNNPRADHNDDTAWTVTASRLPPADTPVEFVIQLPPADA